MEFLKTDLVGAIQFLLPGFIASWIFFSLTAHPKTTPFERVVQALIFTAISQSLVYLVEFALKMLGRYDYWRLGNWTAQVAYVWSVVFSFLLGLVFAWSANGDWFHSVLRTFGITKRTSYPSEWFSAFNKIDRGERSDFVVLHLKGDKPRRLFGRVDEWPDHPDVGHFVIYDSVWLNGSAAENTNSASGDSTPSPITSVDCILIAAIEVEMVEIMKNVEQSFGR